VRDLRLAERVNNLLDRHVFVILGLFTLTYFARAVIVARAKPFWHDEIYTILMSSLPSAGAIWTASLDGADLSPPLNTWLTRVVHAAFGIGPIATRLPALLGFWTMALVVFQMLRRRANVTVAVVGLFLPCFTAAYRYSYEARGYGLMLGLFALSLFAWSEAARGRRRKVYLPLLAVTLAAAFWTHYYAAATLAVLATGELVRLWQSRRPDWGTWGAVGAGLIAALPLGTLAGGASRQSSTFWSVANGVSDLMATYAFLFEPLARTVFFPASIVVLICLIGTISLRRGRTTAREPRRLPAYEIAAGGMCLLIPIVDMLLGVFVTGVFVPRYALPAVVGASLAVPLLVWWMNRHASLAELVLAVAFVGAFGLSAGESLLSPPVYQDPVKGRTVLLAELRSPGPTVVASSLQFLQLWYYTPSEMRGRMRYLLDPAAALRYGHSDTIDLGYAALARWTALPVEPFDQFVAVHRSFRVYVAGSGWLLDKVRDARADIQEISREQGGELLVVTLPPTVAPPVLTTMNGPH
jgi:hypothetical protein